jgi:hypothetical protein
MKRIQMSILSARTLRDSLQKAKGVGLVEERFTVDDCEVVVRNLRPDHYEDILADCKGREDVAYLNAFQIGHVSRAIIELNGQDFRDAEFVDDEEPDPKKPGQMKPVKLPLHTWLEKNVVGTWGKEAVYVAYRKVGDAVEKAEKQSQVGIQFLIADETPEEKFRRVVGEMMELREEVLPTIVERVLDDHGLMLKTTAEEAKLAMEAANTLAQEQIARDKAAAAVVESPLPEQAPVPDIMRTRQPLNTAPRDIQRPDAPPPQNVVPAVRGPAPPLPADAVAAHAIQGPAVVGSAAARAAQMAALELDADQVGALVGEPQQQQAYNLATGQMSQVPMLEHKQEQSDPKQAATIIDQPPRVGLNPHFRPPRRA